MKKSLKVAIGVVIVAIVLWASMFIVDYIRCSNFKMPIFVKAGQTADDGGSGTYYGLGYKVEVKRSLFQLEKVEMYFLGRFVAGAIAQIDYEDNSIAIIKNGHINNETIIEDFINKVNDNTEATLKIREYTSDENYKEKEIKFIPGNHLNETKIDEHSTKVIIPTTSEEYKQYYGYFTFNDEVFNNYHWHLRRKTENDVVTLYFYSYADVTEFPDICSYSLESSNYNREFEVHYYQRKDLGLKTISSEDDYNILTFGGDVSITQETDMVYTLEEALKQKVVTGEKILEQAKEDAEYGICEEGMYMDGGSIEYMYKDYTILKYDTLDKNKDLVFGFSGQIINKLNAAY